jgi:hypothetical protein
METVNDPAPTAAAAPRDKDPEPEPERRAAPIQDHHFQRPIVSPVRPDVRPVPRGG